MQSSLKHTFIRLIQSHQGILNSICNVYFKTIDERKDARQEIILQLWKSYPTFRGDAKPSTWIYRVALNTVLNLVKKKQKEPDTHDLEALNNLMIPPLLDDDIQQLKQLISRLNQADKALVILYLEGYRHEEIGQTLDISVTNVSTRLNRIKEKLRTLYKKYNHESK